VTSSPADDTEVARAVRQARVMTLALAGGVATFAVVVAFLLAGEAAADWTGTLEPSVLPWAAGGAVLLLFLAPGLGRRIARAAAPDQAAVIQAWTAGTLVATGLREAVGVAGLVLGLLAGSLPWALGFASVSIATMLLAWPRPEALRERLRWVERED
jgi:hypothetical protein